MGTKGECWMRWCRMKSPKGGRGRGWRTVRAKFLAIQKETERFYPVSDPYLIRNASHDSSDLFPPFLGIILYIDPGQSHSGRRAAPRRVASHQHHVSSLLPWSKLRAKTSRITHPPSLFRISGVATSLFESTSPFEFLTRQLPLRVPTKGVIS